MFVLVTKCSRFRRYVFFSRFENRAIARGIQNIELSFSVNRSWRGESLVSVSATPEITGERGSYWRCRRVNFDRKILCKHNSHSDFEKCIFGVASPKERTRHSHANAFRFHKKRLEQNEPNTNIRIINSIKLIFQLIIIGIYLQFSLFRRIRFATHAHSREEHILGESIQTKLYYKISKAVATRVRSLL